MSRSLPFRNLAHTLWIARYCQKHNISTSEGIERIAALEAMQSARRRSRREFLVDMGKLAVVGTTLGVASGELHRTLAAPAPVSGNVANVGAGLAGLACGYQLKQK